MEIRMRPIGVVHSPYKKPEDAPPQGGETVSRIEIFKEFKEGLRDLEGFSHLHIIYWLHRSRRYSLLVRTPWDTRLHGVFATRSPRRPNPIGYAVVELLAVEGNVLVVRGLDAIEGTPVLDIKPYFSGIDAKPHARAGWFEEIETREKGDRRRAP